MKTTPIRTGLSGYFAPRQLDAYLLATRGKRRGTVSSTWLLGWQVFEVTEHSPPAACRS
jgi:hypothetical protein